MTSDRAAVFLDRDGVLNDAIVADGKPYPPRSLSELQIPPEAEAGCRLLRQEGFRLICVTNQPDLARGLLRADDLAAINEAVRCRLALDDIYVCPHSGHEGCACRKPKPGLILDAAAAHGIDVKASYVVGDRWRDIEAGLAALCTTVFIDRDYDEKRPTGMHTTSRDLAEAADWIVRHARDRRSSDTITGVAL